MIDVFNERELAVKLYVTQAAPDQMPTCTDNNNDIKGVQTRRAGY